MRAKNNSEAVLITDTGEQLDSKVIFVNEISRDYLGKAKKGGYGAWFIKSLAKESKDIKLVILTSYRPDSYEDIGF